MSQNKTNVEGCWISLILRLAVALIFIAAAVPKFTGGFAPVVTHIQTTFKDTWLPAGLVTFQARLIPWIEGILMVWLIIGFRLRTGWIVAGIYMASLAFGMMVAGKYSIAAYNSIYVLMCCAGLYVSQFDRLNLDALGKK